VKTQINFRASKLTKEQLDELMAYINDTQEGIIAVAVGRMWHEEIPLARRKAQVLEAGDLIGVNAGSNTHGCRDYAILRFLGDGKAICIESNSCTSCWQVGHDSAHVFATVGGTWDVDPERVYPADESWSRTIKWQQM
jgi:hypothetical protein